MSILLVGEDGIKIGEMTFEEAKKIAMAAKKDLVLVNSENNVYRIADSGKLKYEQKQKERSQRAQKRTHKIKEIKLGLTTAQHDIDIKVRRIREFLQAGLKTKITMQLKGRQQAFQNVGFEKMKLIISASIEGGIATMDKSPNLEGRNIIVFLTPAKQ
jgi:translation initiation factor IF-3